MKLFSFLNVFGKEKVKSGSEGLMKFLAGLDPDTMSAAQITMIKEKRDEYADKLILARQALAKDIQETADAQRKVDESKQALAILKGKVDAGSESAMEQARVVAETLKKAMAHLEVERGEDEKAQAFVDTVQKVYDMLTEKLKKAKSDSEDAALRVKQAKADLEHQRMMSEMNGDLKQFSGMDVVLDAMNGAAGDAEREAEVMRMNAESDKDEGEDIVKSLLSEKKSSGADKDDPFALLN